MLTRLGLVVVAVLVVAGCGSPAEPAAQTQVAAKTTTAKTTTVKPTKAAPTTVAAPTVPVPDVAGLVLSIATQQLESAGYKVRARDVSKDLLGISNSGVYEPSNWGVVAQCYRGVVAPTATVVVGVVKLANRPPGMLSNVMDGAYDPLVNCEDI